MLPPGPPISAALQTILYVYDPAAFLEFCHRRYGDVFINQTLLVGPVVLLVNPEDVKQVFTCDPDHARAGDANQILLPLLGRHSVMLIDGPEHLRQRRLLSPPFHGERLLEHGAAVHRNGYGALRDESCVGYSA